MAAPVILDWTLFAPVDRAAAWRVMSDTDAFNRAAGLGFRFDEEPQPDGSVQRTGRVRKFGLLVQWEELPFEYVAPDGFVSRRRYLGGPLARSEVTVQLDETGDGTRIRYQVALFPRSMFSRPLVAADARLTIRPTLTRALDKAMAALSGVGPGLDPPPELEPEEEARLSERLATVAHPSLREALGQRLRHAPLPVIDRLQPLQVARLAGIDATTTVHAFLQATRDGLLEMRFELLCPRCRAGKDAMSTLSASPRVVHCSSCNIRYDGTFPDNIAVVFRPDPAIRTVEVPVDCLLSPARTPHVLAQAVVAPGGSVPWSLKLQAGGYRLDLPGGTAMVEVVEGAAEVDLVVDVESFGVRPARMRVAPGPRTLTLRNRTEGRVAVSLHRQWRPPFTLTAGAMLTLPGVEKVLPADALSPGATPTVRRRVVVSATDPRCLPGDELGPVLRALASEAPLAQAGNQAVVACFDAAEDALAWLSAHDVTELSVGLAVGPVVRLAGPEGVLVGGVPVERAVDAMRDTGAGQVAVHAASKDEPELRAAIDARPELVRREPGTFCHLYLQLPAQRAEALQRLHEAMDVHEVPALVHGWVIGTQVAEGGMGRLFDARGPDEERGVLKLLRPELATDVDACQQLRLEAELAAGIRHPAVVRVYDHGVLSDGRLYLILERLHGRDLCDRLQEDGPLDPALASTLGQRLCDGLGAVHAAGVLHRDLKPANVFLVGDDVAQAKLVDFGIAQRLGELVDGEPGDVILGTVEYMSPEQLQLDPVDHRSDLYALGLVLYEALSGQLPWAGEMSVQVAMQRLAAPPRPLDVTPAALWEVVQGALQVDPTHRPVDAGALGDALREATDTT